MNKKELYEQIMTKVAAEVKAALNEGEDFEDASFEVKAKAALAEYLDLSDEEAEAIEYDEDQHRFTLDDGQEWLIFADYEEAEEYAKYQEENFLEMENPFEMINWDYMPGGMEEYVDTEWFEEAMREDYEAYVEDIESEPASDDQYENRLQQEMAEADLVEDADSDDYVEYLCRRNDDPVQWFIDNFGKDQLAQVCEQNNLLDIKKVAEAVVDTDGPANVLAGYDGNEVELDNGYYAYREN